MNPPSLRVIEDATKAVARAYMSACAELSEMSLAAWASARIGCLTRGCDHYCTVETELYIEAGLAADALGLPSWPYEGEGSPDPLIVRWLREVSIEVAAL